MVMILKFYVRIVVWEKEKVIEFKEIVFILYDKVIFELYRFFC